MPTVKVYSAPNCPYCYAVKAFLDEHGFNYEDIDVAEDDRAREEIINKTGQTGVPVVEIDGQIIIGFDRERICQILNIKD